MLDPLQKRVWHAAAWQVIKAFFWCEAWLLVVFWRNVCADFGWAGLLVSDFWGLWIMFPVWSCRAWSSCRGLCIALCKGLGGAWRDWIGSHIRVSRFCYRLCIKFGRVAVGVLLVAAVMTPGVPWRCLHDRSSSQLLQFPSASGVWCAYGFGYESSRDSVVRGMSFCAYGLSSA